jgi:hypothetical protein
MPFFVTTRSAEIVQAATCIPSTEWSWFTLPFALAALSSCVSQGRESSASTIYLGVKTLADDDTIARRGHEVFDFATP